jgi:tRNA/tmRNA/rRNA uracil-C5-methylase (TrmA/RlmC/RlmD family)
MGYNGNSDSIPIETPLVLWGNGFYHEKILGNTFRVSSSAFLQGHTEMCETLYSKIIELCAECDVVLDLCCGIGTIGICIKNHFKEKSNVKVVGIECCA